MKAHILSINLLCDFFLLRLVTRTPSSVRRSNFPGSRKASVSLSRILASAYSCIWTSEIVVYAVNTTSHEFCLPFCSLGSYSGCTPTWKRFSPVPPEFSPIIWHATHLNHLAEHGKSFHCPLFHILPQFSSPPQLSGWFLAQLVYETLSLSSIHSNPPSLLCNPIATPSFLHLFEFSSDSKNSLFAFSFLSSGRLIPLFSQY